VSAPVVAGAPGTGAAATLPREAVALLAGLTLGWGLNWPVMKVVLGEMAPLHFRAICMFGGAAGLFAIAAAHGLATRVPHGAWPRLALIAAFNMTGWNVLAVYAIPMLDSGRAAILGYTMPVWGVILGALVLHERFTARRAAGVVLGMAGLVLLLLGEMQALGHSPLGAMLMVGAALSWAVGTVLMKRFPVAMPASSFTAWQLVLGGVPVLLGALFLEQGSFAFWHLSFWPAFGVVYNVFVAFVFCQWAWIRIALIAPLGVSTLASLAVPVVGVFSGTVALGERPQWQDYAALVLVAAALATVMPLPRPTRKPQRS
jgi:drug/metabolite transporter (DMT)-like permease